MPSLHTRFLAPTICAMLLPIQPLLAAPETCRSGSPLVCQEWLPSQAEVGKTVEAYYRQQIEKGAMKLRIGSVIRTSTSTISCAALDSKVGSNFVCGGELTFWDVLGRSQALQFSPTFRRMKSGNLAISEFGKWVEPEI